MISRAVGLFRAIRRGRLRDPSAPDESSEATLDAFREMMRQLLPSQRVVEFGTRRVSEAVPTYVHCLCPQLPRENYLLADVRPGIDVDVIVDIHTLPHDWAERFDALVAIAVFEHLERPWIAAREVARVLVPGGFCFISTHQTFPLHGHPSDFFRFSREALELIFVDAGLQIIGASYRYRSRIICPKSMMSRGQCGVWNDESPSYLIVEILARKTA